MSPTLTSPNHPFLVEATLASWSQEEDDLTILTSDGLSLSTRQKVLGLHSKLMANLLSSPRWTDRPVVSVDASAVEFSALISLLTRGEALCHTLVYTKHMVRQVRRLAAALGVDLHNLCIINRSGNVMADMGEEGKVNSTRLDDKNHNSCLLQETLEDEKIQHYENNLMENTHLKSGLDPIEELSEKCKQLVRRVAVLKKKKQQSLDESRNLNQEIEPSALKVSSSLLFRNMNNSLSSSFDTISDTGSIQCASCPKTFKTESKLKFHEMCHANYICNFCKKGYRFNSLLKSHMNTCKEEDLHDCSLCDMKYTSVDDLRDHCKRIHSKNIFVSNNSSLV